MTAFTTALTECDRPNIKSTRPPPSNKNCAAAIKAVGPYDILCGRNKTAFNNVGNRRFRVTISMNLQAYMGAYTKREKSVLISHITEFLQETGARFLKPQKGGGGYYTELRGREARQKVGHALRDMAVARQQSTATRTEESSTTKQQLWRATPQTFIKPQQQQHVQLEIQHEMIEDDNISLETCLESLLKTEWSG